jgi:hypothetical protein
VRQFECDRIFCEVELLCQLICVISTHVMRSIFQIRVSSSSRLESTIAKHSIHGSSAAGTVLTVKGGPKAIVGVDGGDVSSGPSGDSSCRYGILRRAAFGGGFNGSMRHITIAKAGRVVQMKSETELLPSAAKTLVWERRKEGRTIRQIGHLVDRCHRSIYSISSKTCGASPAPARLKRPKVMEQRCSHPEKPCIEDGPNAALVHRP